MLRSLKCFQSPQKFMLKIVFHISLPPFSGNRFMEWQQQLSWPQIQDFFLPLLSKQQRIIMFLIAPDSLVSTSVFFFFYILFEHIPTYSIFFFAVIYIHTELIVASFSCWACLCTWQSSPSAAATSLVSQAKINLLNKAFQLLGCGIPYHLSLS